MFFIKKFLIFGLCGGSASLGVISLLNSSNSDAKKIKSKVDEGFEKYALPNSQDATGSNGLTTLFANNLTTFSTLLNQSFTEQMIYTWATQNNRNIFNPATLQKLNSIKQKEKNKKFVFDEESKDFLSWNADNWYIKKTKEKFIETFQNYLFDENYIEYKNTDIRANQHTTNFDRLTLWADLQGFIVKKWFEDEKPFYIHEKTFNYSTGTAPSSVYKTTSIVGYDFPDFDLSTKEEYKKFIAKLKEENFTYDQTSVEKLYTLEDLKKINDGYLISALLNKHEEYQVTKNIVDISVEKLSNKVENNPLHLFIKDSETTTKTPADVKVKVSKSLLETAFVTDTSKAPDLLGWSNVEMKNSTSAKNTTTPKKYMTWHRNLSGVTALYPGDKYHQVKERLIKNINDKKDNETKTKFYAWLKKDFSSIISSYFVDSGTKNYFKNYQVNNKPVLKGLLEKANKYLRIKNANQSYWTLLTNISKTIAAKANIEVNTTDKSLKENNGLNSPIFFERELDDKTEIKEIVLTDETKPSNWTKNDGSFKTLFSKYFEKSTNDNRAYDNLYKSSISLKTEIKRFFSNNKNSGNTKAGKKLYFFNDYVFDDLTLNFFKNKKLIRQHINNLKISKIIKVDLEKPDLSNYCAYMVELIKNTFKDSSVTTEVLKKIIDKTFYLSEYSKETLALRALYGGYKKTEQGQKIIKAKNYWTIKNYFANDYGYEISSDASSKRINFLYSLHWLLTNNQKNLINSLHVLIPPKEFAALVWVEEHKEAECVSKTEDQVDKLDKLTEKCFKQKENNEIFNPIFNLKSFEDLNAAFVEETSLVTHEAKIKNKTTGSNSEETLSGFIGLHSSKFSSMPMPEFVKKVLFENFLSSNPITNQNYSALASESKTKYFGPLFGLNSNPNKEDNYFETFESQEKLTKYLEKHDLTVSNKLKEDISTKKQEDETIFLKDIVDLLNKQENKSSFKRFSGNLQHPSKAQMTDPKQKFLLNVSVNDTSGHHAFIFQINKFDFLENIENLKNEIPISTVVKALFLLEGDSYIKKQIKNSQSLIK